MPSKYVPFYNVTQAVGRGGTNSTNDVMLIQFFLSEIARVPPHPIPPPVTPLPVNGDPNPLHLLEEWIMWFQSSVRRVGKPITVDGRVDPARTFDDYPLVNNPNTRAFFLDSGTMVNINFTYRRRFTQAHNALEQAPNFPGQLRALFVD